MISLPRSVRGDIWLSNPSQSSVNRTGTTPLISHTPILIDFGPACMRVPNIATFAVVEVSELRRD
jgi:hypothetical protein